MAADHDDQDDDRSFDLTPPPTDPQLNEQDLLRAAYVEQGKKLGELEHRVDVLEHHFAEMLHKFNDLLQDLRRVLNQIGQLKSTE